jgi:hypothetical protein
MAPHTGRPAGDVTLVRGATPETLPSNCPYGAQVGSLALEPKSRTILAPCAHIFLPADALLDHHPSYCQTSTSHRMSTLGTLFAFGVKRVTQEEFERESRSRFEKAASLDAATAEKRRADEEAWGARRLALRRELGRKRKAIFDGEKRRKKRERLEAVLDMAVENSDPDEEGAGQPLLIDPAIAQKSLLRTLADDLFEDNVALIEVLQQLSRAGLTEERYGLYFADLADWAVEFRKGGDAPEPEARRLQRLDHGSSAG